MKQSRIKIPCIFLFIAICISCTNFEIQNDNKKVEISHIADAREPIRQAPPKKSALKASDVLKPNSISNIRPLAFDQLHDLHKTDVGLNADNFDVNGLRAEDKKSESREGQGDIVETYRWVLFLAAFLTQILLFILYFRINNTVRKIISSKAFTGADGLSGAGDNCAVKSSERSLRLSKPPEIKSASMQDGFDATAPVGLDNSKAEALTDNFEVSSSEELFHAPIKSLDVAMATVGEDHRLSMPDGIMDSQFKELISKRSSGFMVIRKL